jgi:CRISPR-associated helicase Cas3
MTLDGLEAPGLASTLYHGIGTGHDPALSAMLDLRMLFSALVDADFLETEAHFEGDASGRRPRPPGPSLDPERALAVLTRHIDAIAARSSSSPGVAALRADLLRACLEAGSHPTGLFTLTAPTGSGKTLALLAFALRHAAEHRLRRVIVVIPYLSIIEQTVRVYREVFATQGDSSANGRLVLEDHSLAGTRPKERARDEDEHTDARLLAENWDAPIVVTTSVQCLESLFANRPSACRKLHRLARSVILFDEVQSLPTRLAVPTLAALSRLAHRYGSSVVFSTATQPAFTHLSRCVKNHCTEGWSPAEIVPPSLDLFGRARRTRVEWPGAPAVTWDVLAQRLADPALPQWLCIVNLKRHALALHQELVGQGVGDLYHLSTSLCSAHRETVLAEVRERLVCHRPCRLVSTQCIEAGVDVDFPLVFRALGPLDAIAQAAGRCNRNGLRGAGQVVVFRPEDCHNPYPDGTYRQAAEVADLMIRAGAVDLDDPSTFERYYTSLYSFQGVGDAMNRGSGSARELSEAIQAQDFVRTAHEYRLIDREAINVLVPYHEPTWHALWDEVESNRLSADWIRRARPHAVGLFRPRGDTELPLAKLRCKDNTFSDEWYVYATTSHYDRCLGLVPRALEECLIG